MEFSLDRHRLYLECPRCNFSARVFCRQVKNREVVICGGCKANIFLVEHLGSFRKAERQMRQALEGLTGSFGNLKFTLKL